MFNLQYIFCPVLLMPYAFTYTYKEKAQSSPNRIKVAQTDVRPAREKEREIMMKTNIWLSFITK